MQQQTNWRPQAIGHVSSVANKWSTGEIKEENEPVLKDYVVAIFCISIVSEAGLNVSKVVQLGKHYSERYLIASRRPVLEEPRTLPPTRGLVPPAPPMPAQAPAPIAVQPPAAEAPPAVPGPTPTPHVRPLPRLTAGGPIALPNGYTLPPGWAVIPAQNVQIVPPAGPNATGVHPAHVFAPQPMMQNIPASPGPPPNLAGTADRIGDATENPPIAPTDHVPGTTRSDNTASTNISHPSTSAPSNTTNTQNNPSNMNPSGPNVMQRPAPSRFWGGQSAHPSYPPVISLVGNTGYHSIQPRTAPVVPPTINTEGASTSSSVSVNPAASTERREPDEQRALLQQMGESVRTLQELVSNMSTMLQAHNLPPATVQSTQQSHPAPPQPIVAQAESPTRSESTILNEHTSTSATLPPLHIKKRRSFSPLERTDENEHPHASRVRRLSSSEDELSPEELADIRAPWVENTIEDGLPLHEVPRQGSPPRVRSPSRSPSRSLLRRGSLLKHDITDDISNSEGAAEMDQLDKGKGRVVFVEDVSEEE